MKIESFLKDLRELKSISDKLVNGWTVNETSDIPYLIKHRTRINAIGNIESITKWEYHVIFNKNYQSPVLYFNAWHPTGELLSLEEVISSTHQTYSAGISANKWNTLTQTEHPYLRRPFYYLHPCKTHELPYFHSANNLVTWLSTIGPVVGLCMDNFFYDVDNTQ